MVIQLHKNERKKKIRLKYLKILKNLLYYTNLSVKCFEIISQLINTYIQLNHAFKKMLVKVLLYI